jgi:hypothetical protein
LAHGAHPAGDAVRPTARHHAEKSAEDLGEGEELTGRDGTVTAYMSTRKTRAKALAVNWGTHSRALAPWMRHSEGLRYGVPLCSTGLVSEVGFA